ncbi:sensor histidine kinase [Sphingomonas sp. 1P08PE]|uniref:sensor histidine kinase n=1 Tax=Sphingomonas sp. 1P08PE TaxID=554122 RepID=UPI0039A32DFD
MSRVLRRRLWLLLAAAAVALVVAAGVAHVTERSARARFLTALAADARLRQALLASEVARFRLLPEAIADDSDLVATLHARPGAAQALNRKLETLAAHTGAAAIYAIGPGGQTLAASNWRTTRSFVGRDYRFRRYFIEAGRVGVAEQFALGTVSGRPGLYLSRRTRDGGVVVVKLEFDRIERQWQAAGGITFATDAQGVVLVTSRPDWRFAAARAIAPASAAAERRDIGVVALRAPPFTARDDGRLAVAGTREAMMMATTGPDASGWRVSLAMPTRRAVDNAVRNAAIAAALATLTLLALFWGWRERARRRAERTQALEAAVAARTADLSREIAERAAAEARAASLRDDLRQANRLAALGQITASVAHETAQPVAAIRTYAASGEQLLDLGATEDLRGNLRAIGRLTERIGAVTAELRGFSRKGSGTIGPLPLAEVIDGARLILKEGLSRVDLSLPAIPAGLMVVAGRVRLEQVVVNLLQNAIEALDGRPDAAIAVRLDSAGAMVVLTIADNGPGIDPAIASRLFTPFATSRPKGLGLGLIIAQDIMNDLGGTLRLVPSDRGAAFAVELRKA